MNYGLLKSIGRPYNQFLYTSLLLIYVMWLLTQYNSVINEMFKQYTLSHNNISFSPLLNWLQGTITALFRNLDAEILRLPKKRKYLNCKGKKYTMFYHSYKLRYKIMAIILVNTCATRYYFIDKVFAETVCQVL